MARLLLVAMLAAAACGDAPTCKTVRGQDCGPDVFVVLRYTATVAADAGTPFGGSDGGACPTGQPCRCALCSVGQNMPLAQYEAAFAAQNNNCIQTWTTATAVTLDCRGSCGNARVPAGAENGNCVWAPPLLP